MMSEGKCQFCGVPVDEHNQLVSFTCGTVAKDQWPWTPQCWYGFVMKLQTRIEILEREMRRLKFHDQKS